MEKSPKELRDRITELEAEIRLLKEQNSPFQVTSKTVSCPPDLEPIFRAAQEKVGAYFKDIQFNPEQANISIDGERYVLMRASSLSIDFLEKITQLYADQGTSEALKIGQNFLFDISHVIGLEDAKDMHIKLNLDDPISKLSAGPVHFAFSGWAYVNIIDGQPTSDENFYLRYTHPHSFEADAWVNKGRQSTIPVCIMNAGYSSGWCEQSFGVPLTAVEIKCRGKGDDCCEFIMAHPNRISALLEDKNVNRNQEGNYAIPMFFERKRVEQKLLKSLEEKTLLLQEVHHRVKNNLQIISSLLNLQSQYLGDQQVTDMFNETKNRIKAIAMVHEKLHETDHVHQYANVVEYLESIVYLLQDSYGAGIDIKIDTSKIDNVKISLEKAIPCGLIINEIVTNAIKHAFKEETCKSPQINIDLQIIDGITTLCISDNGRGISEQVDFQTASSLGLELVRALAEQLDASVQLFRENGTKFVLSFGNKG